MEVTEGVSTVGQQNADIADTLQLRGVAMATVFVFIWDVHWRHLANTTEPSVCDGHAALGLCQITLILIMNALRSRCGHYIFILWFLLSVYLLFSSPNPSRRRLDVYHTSTHCVALARI